MPGQMQHGAEDVGGKVGPASDEGLHQATPGFAVLAEISLRCGKVALQGDGGAVVEGVSERRSRVNPLEAVVGEGQGIEERRSRGHGMHRRAEIVVEAGQGEIQRAGCAAHLGFGLEDFDFHAGLREHDGGRETIGACADDAGFTAASMVRGLRHDSPSGLRCAGQTRDAVRVAHALK